MVCCDAYCSMDNMRNLGWYNNCGCSHVVFISCHWDNSSLSYFTHLGSSESFHHKNVQTGFRLIIFLTRGVLKRVTMRKKIRMLRKRCQRSISHQITWYLGGICILANWVDSRVTCVEWSEKCWCGAKMIKITAVIFSACWRENWRI